MRLPPIRDLGAEHIKSARPHLSFDHGHAALEFLLPPSPSASKGGLVFVHCQGLDAGGSTIQPEDWTTGEVDDECLIQTMSNRAIPSELYLEKRSWNEELFGA